MSESNVIDREVKMLERCANCGCPIENARRIMTGGYLDEYEWACSDYCYDEHIEKGCPLEENGEYRGNRGK